MCEIENPRRSSSLVAALALLLSAAPALAQEPPADPAPPPAPAPEAAPAETPAPTVEARAEALFQEGKRLFEAGQYAAACAKLAESDAVDPTVSTLGLLAGCHEQEGKLATAHREYLLTAERAARSGDNRAEFARARAATLEPRLPKLRIDLARPAPGLMVRRDGEPVPASEIGKVIPVDPGAHEIVARAADGKEIRQTVTAAEGALAVVTVPALGAPVSAAPRPKVDASGGAGAGDAPEAPRGGGARLPAALISGGLGLVGVGFGVGFGLSAMSKGVEADSLHDLCSSPEACARGRQLSDEAFRDATVSTVSFGLGLAGLGASALLLLLPGQDDEEPPPRSIRVAPVGGAGVGGAVLTGRF